MLKKKKNNLNISSWMFVLMSFGFIVYMGYKSQDNYNLSEIHEKNKVDNESIVDIKNEYLLNNDDYKTEIDVAEVENNNQDVTYEENNNQGVTYEENKEQIVEDNETIENNNQENSDIFVNKVVISRNIDQDSESNTYREPIDAFKTISTLDESVIKEIDYYPSLFVWSSVNTENISLITEEEIFKPINLSMIVKCNDSIIDNYNFDVTANTPRWREWVEIDLQSIDNELLNQFWTVEIVDNTNKNTLESRSFKLINDSDNLEQINELTLKKESSDNLINDLYLQPE